MAVPMSQVLGKAVGDLRHHPAAPRIRAVRDGTVVADSRDALLVWEPGRIVPGYAVPESDLHVQIEASPTRSAPVEPAPVILPGTPFAVHSCQGTAYDVVASGEVLAGAAFRPADPDLSGVLLLDLDRFSWMEEDEPVFGHPRDPFHRVDVRRGSRHVRLGLDGLVVAESRRPVLLFETTLPARYYLPRDDVRLPLIESGTRTRCPYKGEATYYSVAALGSAGIDIAWSYRTPLPDCPLVAGLVAFHHERLDLTVDGVTEPRPRRAWSQDDD
ncbi:DUF427 domain-containing protein [Rhodococcus sp. NPDC003318]|uniref:DUF427 domain-containing protein n=1 Tax=Rhodococcus sp. NPDC003318 TaxID=3364503 RepID=UPI00369BAADB